MPIIQGIIESMPLCIITGFDAHAGGMFLQAVYNCAAMRVRLIRRVATALIALLAFAHASLALAACGMERGSMAQAMAMPEMADCDCGAGEVAAPGAACVSHCSNDLQLAGFQLPLVREAATVPVLVVELRERNFAGARLAAPPHPAPPRRILLHSFLI